jgi:hypothetical protein
VQLVHVFPLEGVEIDVKRVKLAGIEVPLSLRAALPSLRSHHPYGRPGSPIAPHHRAGTESWEMLPRYGPTILGKHR